MWSGLLIDIPAGWILCDGNNGTPDLLDRFVVAAGSAYNPEDKGGSNKHTHDFTSDGHNHEVPTYVYLLGGTNYSKLTTISNLQGTTDIRNALPPYFSLAYLMYTG